MTGSVLPARRHKSTLFLIRLVLMALIASMALPAWVEGRLSWILPFVLGIYLLTQFTLLFERRVVFTQQRVQGALILFDLSVLILSLFYLNQYRQDLIFMMLLVILLAASGQRLWLAIMGFLAVAGLYGWISMEREGLSALHSSGFFARLTVLWFVGMYVGYLSESLSSERGWRVHAEDRLRQEIACIQRTNVLVRGMVLDPKGADLMPQIARAAQVMLEAPMVGIACRHEGEREFEWDLSLGLPASLVDSWKSIPWEESPLEVSLKEPAILRIPARPDAPRFSEWSRLSGEGAVEETLIAPFTQPLVGFQGCVIIAWPRPHRHLDIEEEALGILIHQAAISYENSVYSVMAAQARDVWQSVFESIPTPVVITGNDGKVLQANAAFLRLLEADLSETVGTPFTSYLEGAKDGEGRPATLTRLAVSEESSFDLEIPRLGGAYGVSRGPYVGPEGRREGLIWLFRPREKMLVA